MNFVVRNVKKNFKMVRASKKVENHWLKLIVINANQNQKQILLVGRSVSQLRLVLKDLASLNILQSEFGNPEFCCKHA